MFSSIEPRDWIFVKSYGFLSFAKNMGKNIGKTEAKTWVEKTAKSFLIKLKKQQQM